MTQYALQNSRRPVEIKKAAKNPPEVLSSWSRGADGLEGVMEENEEECSARGGEGRKRSEGSGKREVK
jgi:hypothetical protein